MTHSLEKVSALRAPDRAIGIYDSGVGGLTVLAALRKLLPHENYVYFGDTAHLPYGNKSPEQIIDFSRKILSWMVEEKQVKCVVVACNTSSAIALDLLKDGFSLPMIGTIEPMVTHILTAKEKHRRVGIMATPASVKSHMHQKKLLEAGFQGEVLSISCPAFVPLIEEGHLEDARLKTVAREYLTPFLQHHLETLVYGCTHYPFIMPLLKHLLPLETYHVDPAALIAERAFTFLKANHLLNLQHKNGHVFFHVSAHPHHFSTQVGTLLKTANPPVNLSPVTLGSIA